MLYVIVKRLFNHKKEWKKVEVSLK